MKTAVVYVNSHHQDLKYVKEAERSALGFRAHLPDAEYLLYTDAEGFQSDVFDHVILSDFPVPEALKDRVHLNGQMVAKLRALASLDGYDRVMYLGSDTYALSPEAGSVFDVLDQFDIAAAHAIYRINAAHGNSPLPEIPVCFPEFNCDLVVYRNDPKVRAFLKEWEEKYLSDFLGHPHDQGTFRWLVYHSDLRVATLPPEYNYRGNVYRSDTVILQNRDKLHEYLNGQEAPPKPVRIANKILRKLKLPYQVTKR